MKGKYLGKTINLILTSGKEYKILSLEHGYYRVIDDSDEDYLYPAGWFEITDKGKEA